MRRIEYRGWAPTLLEGFDVLCLDTEFTRLPFAKEAIWSWAEHAGALSIGVAAAASQTEPRDFYAVRRVDAALRQSCTPFVLEEVLPLLDAAEPQVEAITSRDLAEGLTAYLDRRSVTTGKPQLLAVDWIGDAYLIEALSGARFDWLLLEDVEAIRRALGDQFPPYRIRHNALHDAQVMRDALARIG